MSIGPVSSSSPVPEQQPVARDSRPARESSGPETDNGSNREVASTNKETTVPLVPQHEVRVQWDTPMQYYIMIYQFLNQQSGSLVLQEPNDQMLNVIHAIRQILQAVRHPAASPMDADAKERS